MKNEVKIQPAQPVLTPEEQAYQDKVDKDYEVLKTKIEGLVDEMFTLDIPVAIIEINADQLFSTGSYGA